MNIERYAADQKPTRSEATEPVSIQAGTPRPAKAQPPERETAGPQAPDAKPAEPKLLEKQEPAEPRRLRLAVVAAISPQWAGSDSIGIARLLLPLLAESYDCDLFEAGKGTVIPEEENGRLGRPAAESFMERAGRYDRLIYMLEHPGQLLPLREWFVRRPGIVVLETCDSISLGALQEGGQPVGQEILDLLKQADSVIVHEVGVARYLRMNGLGRVAVYPVPRKLPIMVTALSKPEIVFACLGGVKPFSRLEQAIACMAQLVAMGWNVRLWAAGAYGAEYGKRLRGIACAYDMTERLELPGRLEPEAYASRMSRSDICLGIGSYSGKAPGDELLDAMAYGKAAIVSAVPAHQRLPDDCVYKMRPEPDEEKELLAAMLELVRNGQLRNRMRRQARAYMSANHSAAKYMKRLNGEIRGVGCGSEEEDPEGEYDAEETVVLPTARQPGNGASTALSAAASVSPVLGRTDLQLAPSKYRRVRKGRAVKCFFSFDLTGLPPNASIRSAVMHIPVRGRKLRVHRISASWNSAGKLRRLPRVRPKPMHSQTRRASKGTAVLQWDCTTLARGWQSGAVGNYGVYATAVSAMRQPWLLVELAEGAGHSHPKEGETS
ncbi:glycosyltransferase [Paenibacillus hodogayensis]|uniref:Glycosyltransferase n=1 Tax=Paenibacillus hodogayensis TaxID=279208 RepID=A0ABV5VT02_9BACL